MPMVLPVLRLCLLLLNLYGTFKAIKPPPMSQRNIRNGQGPSGRAMQLRKREMKSRLAVWVVWAVFAILERPLDRTIGFLIPFYNEFKCTILLFLIVSRSHGAEAIFLHLIHPLVRPYVPAVDNILATLNSVFELVTLIFSLPLEYALHWWHQWGLSRFWNADKDSPSSGGYSPDDSDSEEREEDRRRLRPRNELRQVRMKEAEKRAQVVLQEIENAQEQVRTRTRNQLAAQNNVRTQPVRETRNTDPHAVGLRTRKRVLDHSNGHPREVQRAPGSKSTGVHHLDPTTITELGRGPAPPQLPFPNTSAAQPVALSSPPMRIPTPSSSSQSSHEIWYPPPSVFEAPKRISSPPDTARRTPSPVYPPLPSAYRFTPRRSDPLPPPPRTVTPPDLVTPTLRRISTGRMSRGAVDAYDGIDQFPGRPSHVSASATGRIADPSIHSHDAGTEHNRALPEAFFRQALEPSVQTMDVDMETLSTRDGSSANEESMEGEGRIRSGLRDMADASVSDTDGRHTSIREPVYRITRSGRKTVAPTEPARRSARMRRDRSSSVETDEFGFTIRQDSNALRSLSADSLPVSPLAAGHQSRKKPLARTKPALKPTWEEGSQIDSSDEESVKKRRKLKPGVDQPRASSRNRNPLEMSSLGGDTRPKAGDARKKGNVQGKVKRSEPPKAVLKVWQVGIRATRASIRQPLPVQSRTSALRGTEENETI